MSYCNPKAYYSEECGRENLTVSFLLLSSAHGKRWHDQYLIVYPNWN